MEQYDVIIVGGRAGGHFCGHDPEGGSSRFEGGHFEKGNPIEKRICPKRRTGSAWAAGPATSPPAFAGAGAFSDGKLSLSPDVGGELAEVLGYGETQDLIREVDQVYLRFGAGEQVYGLDQPDKIRAIRKKAIENDLKLIECPIRHLGTEVGFGIYQKIEKHIVEELGVTIHFRTPITGFIIEGGQVKGVRTAEGEARGDKVLVAVGREGSQWLSDQCDRNDIAADVGKVDIGVRLETRNEIMEEINQCLVRGQVGLLHANL